MKTRWYLLVSVVLLITLIGSFTACASTPSTTPAAPATTQATTPAQTSTAPTTTAPATTAPATTTAPSTTAPATSAAGKTLNWKFCVQFIDTDPRTIAMKDWANEVNQKSNGRIQIQVYTSEQLFKGSQILEAISNNSIQLGYLVPTYFAGQLPVTTYLPSSPNITMQNYKQVWNDPAIHNVQAEELAKFNIFPIWWVNVGRVEWFFPQPVTSPSAFSGKLVRVPSANEGLYVTAWNGKPVTMSSGELYTAAQRKTVDAGFTSVSTYKSSKLYEVLPGVLEAGLCMNANMVAINQDAWKSLTADEQKMLVTASQTYSDKLFNTMEDIDTATLKDLGDKGLIKSNKVSAADLVEWAKRVNPVYSEKVNATGALGQKMLEALKKYEVK